MLACQTSLTEKNKNESEPKPKPELTFYELQVKDIKSNNLWALRFAKHYTKFRLVIFAMPESRMRFEIAIDIFSGFEW